MRGGRIKTKRKSEREWKRKPRTEAKGQKDRRKWLRRVFRVLCHVKTCSIMALCNFPAFATRNNFAHFPPCSAILFKMGTFFSG